MPDTLTVLLEEMHEDFKTLKEEVQRETQEVEKLSPVGRSSLLTSLSHLLGKKKELQDLEQKVRAQSTGSMEGGKCGWWQPLQMGRGTGNGTVTKGCRINSRCPSQVHLGCWTTTAPFIPERRTSVQGSRKWGAPSDGQRVP